MGSGRSHLVKCLFGIDPVDSGTVRVDGARVPAGRPIAAIKHGVALVPEDRKGAGVVVDMSIRNNLVLTNSGNVSSAGWFDRRGANGLASKLAGLVGITAERLPFPVAQLSGGNQQRVAIARWLERDTAVLIVDEPTRGIDVGAKEDIYRLLRDIAAKGTAVLVVSSEFDELFTLCHRLIVMSGGRFVSELDPRASTPEEVLRICSTDSELAAHGD